MGMPKPGSQKGRIRQAFKTAKRKKAVLKPPRPRPLAYIKK